LFRIHVDQLHDPVRIAAGRRGEQARDHLTRDRDIGFEWRRLPAQDVRPIVDETLILHQPGGPLRAPREVGGLDRSLPVRHGKRRIGDERVVTGGRCRLREAQCLFRAEIQRALFDLLLRRPRVPPLPPVAARLERQGFG
jgi:hypothetical protein